MYINRLSLSRLRALITVCKTRSFSAAAAELRLTQPAVSAQIRQLEDEIGVMLVERIGKRAKPTPEGSILIACAKWIFAELEKTVRDIEEMKGEVSSPVRVGAGATATIYLLPKLLAALKESHPNLKLTLSTGNTAEIVEGVLAASIDIAIVTAPVSDNRLSQEFFFEDRLVCIAPPDVTSPPSAIRPCDLDKKRLIVYERGGLIRKAIDEWLSTEPDTAPDLLEIGNAEALKTYTLAGHGWAITSEITVQREGDEGRLQIIPLSPPVFRHLVTVWLTNRTNNPAISAVRKALSRRAAKVRTIITD